MGAYLVTMIAYKIKHNQYVEQDTTTTPKRHELYDKIGLIQAAIFEPLYIESLAVGLKGVPLDEL